MVDLPTLTVTDEQAGLVLEAFGGVEAVAIPAYQDWLARALIAYIIEKKRRSLRQASLVEDTNTLAAFVASLPQMPPLPEAPEI